VSGPVFIICALGLVWGGTEGVGSRLHVLRSQTRFRWYQGRWVPFSSFALPNTFLAVSRASGPIFQFCAPGLFLGGIEGVGSSLHVLCSQSRFRRYRGRRGSFSCFALMNAFWAVPRASGPVFMFCAPGLVFGWYRGRQGSFSCFKLPKSFWAVPRP
jgi:hypothetical protein